MEKEFQKTETNFFQSLTFKAFMVVFLTLLLLIPQVMIRGLINERKVRSKATIARINEKWSSAQTVCPPAFVIPYAKTVKIQDVKGFKESVEQHELFVTPETTTIDVSLQPEPRHYGIFKSIVYRSNVEMQGSFRVGKYSLDNSVFDYSKSYISLYISDLRGITQEIVFSVNGKSIVVKNYGENIIKIPLANVLTNEDSATYNFSCKMKLNGSEEINFVPLAKTTAVKLNGAWNSPSFTGNFAPDLKTDAKAGNFAASWNVLSFNRSIPETWSDASISNYVCIPTDVNIDDARDYSQSVIIASNCNSFGVKLIQPIDQYQQNERSVKYALLFIALTFVAFYFVEALTKKRIHIIQYLLVGIALILFYSLLLSFSEQIGFGWAYLVAAAATVTLITLYVKSIFKNTKQTLMLGGLLCLLYIFLYVVLQLEDLALLIGSVGLFAILGVIMYVSRKIQWK